eukprot:scaffold100052_cov19-Tisochrysis_lutea.AAC.1
MSRGEANGERAEGSGGVSRKQEMGLEYKENSEKRGRERGEQADPHRPSPRAATRPPLTKPACRRFGAGGGRQGVFL